MHKKSGRGRINGVSELGRQPARQPAKTHSLARVITGCLLARCRNNNKGVSCADSPPQNAFPCGVGAIGTLVAHNLRRALPSAEIALLTRRAKHFREATDSGEDRTPELAVTRGGAETRSTGYVLDVVAPERREGVVADLLARGVPLSAGGPIDSLIVCTKAQATSDAIAPVAERLRPGSVVTLLQNGMGVYDELCARFWPEAAGRPHFVLGSTTHGVTPGPRPGAVTHVSRPGEGALTLGLVPDPRGRTSFDRWLWGAGAAGLPAVGAPPAPGLPLPPLPAEPHVRATLEALLALSELNPEVVPMPNLYHALLLKLAVNASINPLTAVLGGGVMRNGDLVRSSPGFQLIKQTAAETSAVLTAYLRNLAGGHPPEPEVLRLFSAPSLEARIKRVALQTQDNISSMASDIKLGRDTEIDYINGFVVALGQRLGVPTPQHRMLVQMVKLRAELAGVGRTFLPTVVQAVQRRGERAEAAREVRLEERTLALEERRLRAERVDAREAQLAKRDARRRRKAAARAAAEERAARERLLSSEMPALRLDEDAK